MNLAAQKRNIDFVSVLEAAGVDLRRSGSRFVGLCPFHTEKTPSFFVFDDQRFYCFGCGEHGDPIDFIQKLHGLSFPDALKFLGIERGGITPEIRRDIKRRKRRTELVKAFREWEQCYGAHVGDLIFKTEKLMVSGIAPEDLNLYAPLFHQLPVWQHELDILVYGDDEQKYKLFKEAKKNGRFQSSK